MMRNTEGRSEINKRNKMRNILFIPIVLLVCLNTFGIVNYDAKVQNIADYIVNLHFVHFSRAGKGI